MRATCLPISTDTPTTERHELWSSSSNKCLQLLPLPLSYKFSPQPFLMHLQVGLRLMATWCCVDWKIIQNMPEKRGASETPVTNYQSTQRNIPGDIKLHHHRFDNFKSRTHATLCNERKIYDFRHTWNSLASIIFPPFRLSFPSIFFFLLLTAGFYAWIYLSRFNWSDGIVQVYASVPENVFQSTVISCYVYTTLVVDAWNVHTKHWRDYTDSGRQKYADR